MQHSELTGGIIRRAIELHRTLGPGQTQTHYASSLATALRDADLTVKQRVKAWKRTDGRWHLVGTLHLVVEGRVGVLVTTRNRPPDDRQRMHLRRIVQVRGLPVGLALNFGPHRVDIGRVDERVG